MKNDSPPILKSEILELFEKEEYICIINSKRIINDKLRYIKGNGFFIELNEACIPFNKCLITCNHLLNEEDIKIGNIIILEYQNKKIKLDITKIRRVFTDKQLDYTLIEIFDNDKIKYFFPIQINPNFDEIPHKNDEVFLLQYPRGSPELVFSYGKILEIRDDNIIHNCSSVYGSGGGPLLLRKNLLVIGIHIGSTEWYKIATSIKSIIEDIKKKSVIFKSIDYKEKYKNLEKIGNGNFGTVFKGTKDKENWALKIIDKEDMRKD